MRWARQASPSPARGISTRLRCGRRFANFSARSRPQDPTRWRSSISPATACSSRARIISCRSMPIFSVTSTCRCRRSAFRISRSRSRRCPGHVKIVILDAARQNPFARGGQPLASGLALVDPAPNMAIAFNAAPGTMAPEEQGPYGAYATALTEMIGAGGLSLDDIFSRVRLRVSTLTQGAEVPWYASQIDGPFFMTERAADAPPLPNTMPVADIRNRPMLDYGNPDDAYAAASPSIRSTGYEQYLAAYPGQPLFPPRRRDAGGSPRRDCLAALRDGRHPPAYWSYLRRYPNGPHAWDARRGWRCLARRSIRRPILQCSILACRRRRRMSSALSISRILMFDGPGFLPPPPPPLFFLPARPREFARLPPPPPPRERFFLPTPAAAAVPAFVRPPRTVAVRPAAPGATITPGGRPGFSVSLPAAVSHAAPGTPGARPAFGTPGAGAPPPGTPHLGGPGAPAPSSAFVRPAAPLPHPPGGPGEAPPSRTFVRPGELPPHPPGAPGEPPPPRTFVTPGEPPPHPGPAPAFVKPPVAPATTPPAPLPHPGPAPAFEKPPPRPAPTAVKPRHRHRHLGRLRSWRSRLRHHRRSRRRIRPVHPGKPPRRPAASKPKAGIPATRAIDSPSIARVIFRARSHNHCERSARYFPCGFPKDQG